MANRQVIITELEKLGDAVGYKLQENRYPQYIEDLQKVDDQSFIAACTSLRLSWDRASFPPIGAFMNKIKDIRGDGRPNSVSNTSSPKKPLDPKMVAALKKHEEYLKMSPEEYMKVMIAAGKEQNRR